MESAIYGSEPPATTTLGTTQLKVPQELYDAAIQQLTDGQTSDENDEDERHRYGEALGNLRLSEGMIVRETEVLKPMDPSLLHDDKLWPIHQLIEVIVQNPKTGDVLENLFAASAACPLVVTGLLCEVSKSHSDMLISPQAIGSFINIGPVYRYAHATFTDGTIGVWAAGRAGWYEIISPAQKYKHIYDEMVHDVQLLYFVEDHYPQLAETGRRKKIPGTADDVFASFAQTYPHLCQNTHSAKALFHQRRYFLIKSMVDKNSTKNWRRTSFFDHMQEQFPGDFARVKAEDAVARPTAEAERVKAKGEGADEPIAESAASAGNGTALGPARTPTSKDRYIFGCMRQSKRAQEVALSNMTIETYGRVLYRDHEIASAEEGAMIIKAHGPELMARMRQHKDAGFDWTKCRIYKQLRGLGEPREALAAYRSAKLDLRAVPLPIQLETVGSAEGEDADDSDDGDEASVEGHQEGDEEDLEAGISAALEGEVEGEDDKSGLFVPERPSSKRRRRGSPKSADVTPRRAKRRRSDQTTSMELVDEQDNFGAGFPAVHPQLLHHETAAPQGAFGPASAPGTPEPAIAAVVDPALESWPATAAPALTAPALDTPTSATTAPTTAAAVVDVASDVAPFPATSSPTTPAFTASTPAFPTFPASAASGAAATDSHPATPDFPASPASAAAAAVVIDSALLDYPAASDAAATATAAAEEEPHPRWVPEETPTISTFGEDRPEIWRCTSENCGYRVFNSDTSRGQAIIRDHVIFHAEVQEEALRLRYGDMYDDPIARLIDEVRAEAARARGEESGAAE